MKEVAGHCGSMLQEETREVVEEARIHSVAGSSGHLSRRFLRGGELHNKKRAAFGLVLASDLAAVFLNDSIDRTQAEAGTFADGLGCIEGIEDAFGLANTGTGIAELQYGLAAEAVPDDFQRAAAAFVQRVHGVLNDFDEGLKQLVGVALHAGEAGRDRGCNANFPGSITGLQHLGGTL